MSSSDVSRYGGQLVYARRDPWGLIEVVDHQDRRSLHFGSSIEQSCRNFTDRPNPGFHYDRKMVFGAALHPEPEEVLILGIGGGSVARHLHECLPDSHITAVERREAVIDIALEYFNLPADDRLQLFTADAEQFLIEAPSSWDLVLVDLFDAIGIDETALRLSFLDRCFSQLRRNGLLVMNLWRDEQEAYMTASEYLETCFNGRVWYLDESDGNTIAYAFRDEFPEFTAAIQETAVKLGIDGSYLLRQLQRRNSNRITGNHSGLEER